MTHFHSLRFFGALLALTSMLFMQLVLATYVCPSLSMGQASDDVSITAQDSMPEMVGCMGMVPQQATLCHASSHKQALDQPKLANLPAFIPTSLTLWVANIEPSILPLRIVPVSELLAHATAPPLSIQHCCFRI